MSEVFESGMATGSKTSTSPDRVRRTIYCHTCDRWLSQYGVMNHRKAHRVRKEKCEITFTHGNTIFYDFS
jgi:hypothetical protein